MLSHTELTRRGLTDLRTSHVTSHTSLRSMDRHEKACHAAEKKGKETARRSVHYSSQHVVPEFRSIPNGVWSMYSALQIFQSIHRFEKSHQKSVNELVSSNNELALVLAK